MYNNFTKKLFTDLHTSKMVLNGANWYSQNKKTLIITQLTVF